MRVVLQVLGGVWIVSMLLTVSSCLYLGHVVESAASRPAATIAEPDPAALRAALAARAEEVRAEEADPAFARPALRPAPMPTATYVPGRPMLDPTPPADRHGW